MAEDRELGRKRAEDPMTKYCVYETGGDAAKNQSGSSRLFHDASQIEAKDATDTVVEEEEDIHNRKQQRRKQHRRDDLLTTNPGTTTNSQPPNILRNLNINLMLCCIRTHSRDGQSG